MFHRQKLGISDNAKYGILAHQTRSHNAPGRVRKFITDSYTKFRLTFPTNKRKQLPPPSKVTLMLLRRSALALYLVDIGITPASLAKLTRHKTTETLEKHYARHASAGINKQTFQALAAHFT